jgi:hypothetical protein
LTRLRVKCLHLSPRKNREIYNLTGDDLAIRLHSGTKY